MLRIVKKLLSTESSFNPKVILTRIVVRVIPNNTLHALKKHYYVWLIQRFEEVIERDALALGYFVHPGDNVIDVGAHIGLYTAYLARLVEPGGRVHSIEPFPATFEWLNANVRKLDLRNVELHNCAASDFEGSVEMEVPKWKWGVEASYGARIIKGGGEPGLRRATVVTRTLDSIAAAFREKIAFIKCDVEYHELECLKGALKTIRHSNPVILVEILTNLDTPGSCGQKTLLLLSAEGYAPYCFDGRMLYPRREGQRSQNYFFLSPRHVAELRKSNLVAPLTSSRSA